MDDLGRDQLRQHFPGNGQSAAQFYAYNEKSNDGIHHKRQRNIGYEYGKEERITSVTR